jgi:hypothetical protein
MNWYTGFVLFSLLFCLTSLLIHVFKIVRFGVPEEYSQKKGNTSQSVRYAFSGAMSPFKKESAYLHLPTYTAGIIYHLGTFVSFGLLFFILPGIIPTGVAGMIFRGFLSVSSLCGILILIKRAVKHDLRSLSNPDDYISNFLVNTFQILTFLVILDIRFLPLYFTGTGLLLLYVPVGKLKHTVYFFAARYHLGIFYGWRNIWPPR